MAKEDATYAERRVRSRISFAATQAIWSVSPAPVAGVSPWSSYSYSSSSPSPSPSPSPAPWSTSALSKYRWLKESFADPSLAPRTERTFGLLYNCCNSEIAPSLTRSCKSLCTAPIALHCNRRTQRCNHREESRDTEAVLEQDPSQRLRAAPRRTTRAPSGSTARTSDGHLTAVIEQ